jgi:hypothetical protein
MTSVHLKTSAIVPTVARHVHLADLVIVSAAGSMSLKKTAEQT